MTDESQARMLGWLARMINAKRIVEAGTHKGYTTRILAEINPDALVMSADIIDHNPGGMPNNVGLYRGDFMDMIAEMPEIDFAYIDASGETNLETRLRWTHAVAVMEKLTKHGIVAWDDTLTEWDGVREIRGVAHMNIHALKGLSLYQKQ